MMSYSKTKTIRRRKTKPFRFSIARLGEKNHITAVFPNPLLKPLLILISILLVLLTKLPNDVIPHLFA